MHFLFSPLPLPLSLTLSLSLCFSRCSLAIGNQQWPLTEGKKAAMGADRGPESQSAFQINTQGAT